VYVLLTTIVCDEDTTANGPAIGGLSQCVLKGTRTQQSNINTMTACVFVILFL